MSPVIVQPPLDPRCGPAWTNSETLVESDLPHSCDTQHPDSSDRKNRTKKKTREARYPGENETWWVQEMDFKC